MRNTNILAASLIMAVIVILGGVYFTLKHFQERALLQEVDPFSLIPSDAFLVLHVKSPSIFLESVEGNGPAANHPASLITGKMGLSTIRHIDSVVKLNYRHYEIWQNAVILISRHFENSNKTSNYLLQFVPTKNIRPNNLPDVILSAFDLAQQAKSQLFLNHEILAIDYNSRTVYVSQIDNSIVLSTSSALIKKSISSGINRNGINTLAEIAKLRRLSGRFADNLYLNTQSLCQLIEQSPDFIWPFATKCEAMMGWHGWDISFNTGHLLFHGFTLPSAQQGGIASLVRHQNNIKPEIHQLIPSQTAVLFYMGLSDTDVFRQQLHQIINDTAIAELLETSKTKFTDVTGLLPENIADIWQGELAYVIMDNTPLDEGLIILEIGDKGLITENALLAAFFREIKMEGQDTKDTSKIFRSNIPGLIPLLTHGFVIEDYNYVTFIDRFMVVAKEKHTLLAYTGKIGLDGNFGNAPSFGMIAEKFPESHNIKLHILPQSIAHVQNKNNEGETEKWGNFNNLGHIALQIIPSKDTLFFSNLLIHQNTETTASSSIIWQTPLKAAIHKGPFKVFNHNDRSPEIIVQDVANNLYLVDLEGKIKWSFQLSGPIMSDVFQVDVFSNNRYQYLFNTRNYLHLIDRRGRYVSGFPMRLPSPATAGIAVFDYDNTKDYRILFPTENRKIFNYTLDRKPVRGWYYSRSAHRIESPLQHIRLAGTDYIFATDIQGNIEILNRRGQNSIIPKQTIKVNPGARVFAGTIAGDPHFVIAGERGALNLIRPDGSIKTFAPDTFSQHHRFVYRDIVPDREMEMIYLDNNTLSLYNFSNGLKFSLPFPGNVNSPISIINLNNKDSKICVTDLENKQIFMVDVSGNIVAPFPVQGNKAFYFDRNRYNQQVFITGLDSLLICYYIDF